MEKLNKISKQLEDSFSKLEEAIKSIDSTKEFIDSLTSSSDNFVNSLKDLKENDKLISLSRSNNDLGKNIRKNISQIQNNLGEIEVYRKVFEDNIVSYNTKIENFNKSFDEKAKIASNTNQTLSRVIKHLNESERKHVNNRKQLTEIAVGIDFLNKFDEVKKEQVNINKKLDIIYNAITGNEFDLNNFESKPKKQVKKEDNNEKKLSENTYFLSNRSKGRINNLLKNKSISEEILPSLKEIENITYYHQYSIEDYYRDFTFSNDNITNESKLVFMNFSTKNKLPDTYFKQLEIDLKEKFKRDIDFILMNDQRNKLDNLIIDLIIYK